MKLCIMPSTVAMHIIPRNPELGKEYDTVLFPEKMEKAR